MQLREKLMLCALPYLLAAYLWYSLTNPAVSIEQERSQELDSKLQEMEDLKVKVARFATLRNQKEAIEREIDSLRGVVPKRPDLDIFEMDLEKICLASNVDLVAFVPPGREKVKELEEIGQEGDQEAEKDSKTKRIKTVKPQAAQAKPQAAKPAAAGKGAPEVESGLAQKYMQVTVIGFYPDLINLFRRLESYKRVIDVGQIEMAPPPQAGKKRTHQTDLLDCSFMVTAYYLP